MSTAASSNDAPPPGGELVLVTFDEGIAWVALNRPDKRNAINPALASEMCAVLDALELDERCGVIVLTGNDDAFSAGMDLKEYFREFDAQPEIARIRRNRMNSTWQWRQLRTYVKPTIAMVSGWCFGGAFVPLCACDLAIAAEDATFGLSEINWGIIPGGNVTKAVADMLRPRDALYYIMTGRTFDGTRARDIGLVNEAVPKDQLRQKTRELALELLEKNATVLYGAKTAFKNMDEVSWDLAYDYLMSKSAYVAAADKTRGRTQGMKQFLDDKTYRPGLGAYTREQ